MKYIFLDSKRSNRSLGFIMMFNYFYLIFLWTTFQLEDLFFGSKCNPDSILINMKEEKTKMDNQKCVNMIIT